MANAEPFLRWAGGKRWLAKVLAPILAARLGRNGTYFEPFLGSGAVFFALQPERAVLSDQNTELMTTFREVALHPEMILNKLAKMPSSREEYYRVRKSRPRSDLSRAVRFLYLNRNCYGGLYRENMQGVFNVPYGGGDRNHRFLCANDTLQRASTFLSKPGVELHVCDFETVLSRAGEGDVAYCDPTYRGVTRNQFDRYGRMVFRWADQLRLSRHVLQAYERGSVVVLSNTTCNGILDLYHRKAIVIEAVRRKGLGPQGNGNLRQEYVFILDPQKDSSCWKEIGRQIEILGDDEEIADCVRSSCSG